MEDVIVRGGVIQCLRNIIENLCDGVRCRIRHTLCLPCIGCGFCFLPCVVRGSGNCLSKARRIKVGVNKRKSGVHFIEVRRYPYSIRGKVDKGQGGEIVLSKHSDVKGHEGISKMEWNDVGCPLLIVQCDDVLCAG